MVKSYHECTPLYIINYSHVDEIGNLDIIECRIGLFRISHKISIWTVETSVLGACQIQLPWLSMGLVLDFLRFNNLYYLYTIKIYIILKFYE